MWKTKLLIMLGVEMFTNYVIVAELGSMAGILDLTFFGQEMHL